MSKSFDTAKLIINLKYQRFTPLASNDVGIVTLEVAGELSSVPLFSLSELCDTHELLIQHRDTVITHSGHYLVQKLLYFAFPFILIS